MLLYCYLVKYDMLIKIKSKKLGPPSMKRKVYYDPDNKVYVKKHNYFGKDEYERITTLVPKAYPNMLIDSKFTQDSMEFTYKEIPGRVSTVDDEDLYQFFLDDLDRTWPIAHGDWKYRNVIVQDHKFYMIDYDRISTKYKSKADAIEDIKKCFSGNLLKSGIKTTKRQ
jgi:hypothetical protein